MKILNLFRTLILVLFLLITMSLHTTPKMSTRKPLESKPIEFGIIEHEDIYVDNREKGRYTNHGRLKQQDK